MALESRHKSSYIPSLKSPAVGQERTGQWVILPG